MFYTYILKSINNHKFYTGHTDNLVKRLSEHNSGKEIYSKRYAPWEIVYYKSLNTESDAVKLEKYFKSAAGRRWLKKNVNINK